MENNEEKLSCADGVGEAESSTASGEVKGVTECASDALARAFAEAECRLDGAELEADSDSLLHADGNFDSDEYFSEPEDNDGHEPNRGVRSVFDFIEMLALVTMSIILCFSFIFRLNTVEGPSMENTLHTGEYLFVSDLFYDPEPGDIVVIHDITKGSYADPIVKRVIATAGQTVDIDFTTWTLTVDGKTVDESSYRKLDGRLLTSSVDFPLTVAEGTVFVMGDNRNHSADSRLAEIGLIDERCIVGKVYARIFPFNKFTPFKNPYTTENGD